jgi:hypothetical protein
MINVLPAGALATTNGSNAAAAAGGLAVAPLALPGGPGGVGIPTMGEWAMILLTLILFLSGLTALRRRGQ